MARFPYQDASLSPDERTDDLLGRMSLEEKAGLMFHAYLSPVDIDFQNPHLPLPSARELINRGMNHFAILGSPSTIEKLVEWVNAMQTAVMEKRWGIPVTLSSDPRHAFADNPGLSNAVTGFSEWPEQIGMVAIGNEDRMYEMGDIVRQEYLAIGMRGALHPQVDLSTEPRWSRIPGSMGEDADLASRLAVAYIRGMHTDSYGPDSVLTCAKHFPGGGPQEDGTDPHFPWGSDQIYPGNQFDYHLRPFQAAIDAGVRSIMPSYGKPVGTKYEEVGMCFQKEIITDLLKGQCGFKGIVVTDFGLMEDRGEKMRAIVGDIGFPKCWGLEHLTLPERMLRLLEAGTDQFGGDSCVGTLIDLVKSGRVPESRVDQSARLILWEKFKLGLFEKPFADPAQAKAICKSDKFAQAGLAAQRDSLVLLTNKKVNDKLVLPIAKQTKVYAEGVKEFPEGYAQIVSNPADADVILVRLQAPFVPRGTGIFAAGFHHGPLEFPSVVLANITSLAKHAPVIVEIFSDRPPILGSILDDASAIVCSFGSSIVPILDVLFGVHGFRGKLPFDLPRSDEAIIQSRSDMAFDTQNPTFKFGHGLAY